MGGDTYMLNDAAAGAGEKEGERLNKQFFILNEVMEVGSKDSFPPFPDGLFTHVFDMAI
jgi:hypothetical protein